MNIFRFTGDMFHLVSILVLLLKIYATKSCSGISLKTQELYAVVFVARYLDLFTDFISLYNYLMKIVFIGSSLAIVWCMRWHHVVRRSYDSKLDTFRHQFLVVACFVLALIVNEKFTFQELRMVAWYYYYHILLLFPLKLAPFCLDTRINESVCVFKAKLHFHPWFVLHLFLVSHLSWSLSNSLRLLQGRRKMYSFGGKTVLDLFDEIFWAFSIYLEAVAILPQLVLLQRSGNVDNLTGQYVFFLGAYRALYLLNWAYRYLVEQRFTRWISVLAGLVQTGLYADFFYYYFISWKNNAKLKLPS